MPLGVGHYRAMLRVAVTGFPIMKYADGSYARLGDRVRIVNGDTGVIVASMDTNEYSPEYPAENYADLQTGILILTDKGALVRFEEPAHSKLLFRDS